MDWELLDHEGCATPTNHLAPPLQSSTTPTSPITSSPFFIHPTNTSNPPLHLLLPLISSHDSDSVSDSMPATVLPQTPTEGLLLDAQAAAGGGALDSHVKEEEEEKKEVERSAVWWWKVPLEVFKYWVVRVSPVSVWSLSAAAAASFLGLVILGRRLYKMERKTQTLKRNVALDDKKVSQLMGRVARLNEAFSVVRCVPIVRPSLPAPPSVTLRPVVSIR